LFKLVKFLFSGYQSLQVCIHLLQVAYLFYRAQACCEAGHKAEAGIETCCDWWVSHLYV